MIIDLTKTIHDGMAVYPGDPQVSLKRIANIQADGYENYLWTTSMHAGTHIDGPKHMLTNQKNIAQYPLDLFMGLGKKTTPTEPYVNQGESILLIETNALIDVLWVESILKSPIRIIVIEGVSPDESPYEIHHRLFSHGIFIVENATNFGLLPSNQLFKTHVIPLKIEADSSPCRIFVEL